MLTTSRDIWVRKVLLSLVVLAVLALTFSSLELSGASFTSGAANPGSVFTAGNLSHVNDRDGQLTIDASGLTPGATCAGTMTLLATGDLDGDYTLRASRLTDTPGPARLSTVLTLTIEEVGEVNDTLYDGPVAGFSSAALGTVWAGTARTYVLSLAYPEGPNDAALQGATMVLELVVAGVAR